MVLQTGEYARALISRSGNVPAEEIDERVAARLARQSLFSRDRPARFTFYVHEFVLRTPVGARRRLAGLPHHRHPLTPDHASGARSPTVRRITLPRWYPGALGWAEFDHSYFNVCQQ